ncbi:hypothetical protein GCM10023321_26150 [Pseudonocardia eucalypti]|uniref:Uncharacterized protein n=1 Tax=Pseudonocardia eucalypti TaxID=648755 RepID=A0ABP9Q173_9PSEU|nr:hypothetical protein [Pseudonocardia eucalypti]
MSRHTSTITATAVRVAGSIPVEVSVRHIGTTDQEAGMRMGELLVYVRSPFVAERVADTWHMAKPVVCAAVPPRAAVGKLHVPVRVALVGTIVRLAGHPVCTIVGVPARSGHEHPAHVRIEVGPLAWEVCDQLAWHTITRAWRRLARMLNEHEE